jgi:hypothetical protein
MACLPAIATVATIGTTITAAPAATTTMTAAPATAATVAATSAAITSATATAAPATATTTGALGLRPRFVDYQVSSAEVLTVQRINRPIGIFVIAHFNEGEAARLPGETIADQIYARGSYTDLREPLLKLIIRRGKRKIPNIELLHLPAPSARNPVDESRSAPKRRASYTGSPGSPATTGARQALQRSRAWSRKLTAFATGKTLHSKHSSGVCGGLSPVLAAGRPFFTARLRARRLRPPQGGTGPPVAMVGR